MSVKVIVAKVKIHQNGNNYAFDFGWERSPSAADIQEADAYFEEQMAGPKTEFIRKGLVQDDAARNRAIVDLLAQGGNN